MSFELVWILQFILTISGEILQPKELKRNEGEEVDFKFTTKDRNSIRTANFGKKTSLECDHTMKLIIVTTQIVTHGKDLDTASDRQYKNRAHFIGNISLGHAWFRLINVSVADQGVYAACIRQDTDLKRKMYEVKLSVKPSSKRGPSARSTIGSRKSTTSSSNPESPVGLITLPSLSILFSLCLILVLAVPKLLRVLNDPFLCQRLKTRITAVFEMILGIIRRVYGFFIQIYRRRRGRTEQSRTEPAI
ncbi:uncharacterized protein LOC116287853 [Actinia tenebrosa]|uniref:Uncharacterized protein LOC116287853 n=1 Tax=Actinia tenebrosa TaxID=6105 RepID=A0A6P8HCJ9_ACTTE|nr:uncharacterized protein LOC116287853 [Actinia tenebrosa]